MLTILTGKNCVLLNPIQEFIETEAWYVKHFSYVEKITIKDLLRVNMFEQID